jgi:ABC-type sugar transport system permease subunit
MVWRLTTNQEIAGSIPALVKISFFVLILQFSSAKSIFIVIPAFCTGAFYISNRKTEIFDLSVYRWNFSRCSQRSTAQSRARL